MRLVELIAALDVESVRGDADVEISDLAYDSTQAAPGALFLCVRGMTTDGHQFAPDAVDRGAVALVVERQLDLPVPQVVVVDARAAMSPLAVRFWRDPTAELAMVGITGTNGKTTTAFLLRGILEDDGRRTGALARVLTSQLGEPLVEPVKATPFALRVWPPWGAGGAGRPTGTRGS